MTGSIEKLDDKMRELLDTVITERNVTQLINSYKPVLEKTMPLYPDIDRLEMSPDELNTYLDGIYSGILENYEAVHKALEYPAPMFVAAPERSADGSVHFAWEVSYSYQGRPVTYNIRLYEDPHRQNLIFEQTDIVQTEFDYRGRLASGTYYLQVTSVDSAGNEQISLEHVQNSEVFVYGLLECTIE